MCKHDIYEIVKNYHSNNDNLKMQAKIDIIENYSRFISYIIKKKYYCYRIFWEDLFQCGICGLLRGLETYNPYISKPTTYFYFYIIHEINEFIYKDIKRTSRYYDNKLKALNSSIATLKSLGIENPSINDLAQSMNVNSTKIYDILKIINISQPVSLDYLIDCNLVGNSQVNAENYIEKQIQRNILKNAVLQLPEQERKLIIYKYGLLGHPRMTTKEISEKTGLPPNKIRLYIKKGIQKIRKNSNVKNWFKS